MKTQKRIYEIEPKHLARLLVSGAAIFAVFLLIFIKALLLGEFKWLANEEFFANGSAQPKYTSTSCFG